MELLDYEVSEYVEEGGNMHNFEKGNGLWWSSVFHNIGYGFGYREDFTNSENDYFGMCNYPSNLIFNI